jgi:dihydrofolate reductase
MDLTLLAAMDRQRLIGRSDMGGLPWHLPSEANHFRACCHGKVVVVGRRTFREMDGWFERVGATALLLTSRTLDEKVAAVREPAKVIHAAAEISPPGATEIIVAGGAQTYAALLPMATRMLLSEIDGDFQGDLFFPDFDAGDWTMKSSIRHEAVPDDPERRCAFTIVEWIRRQKSDDHE